MLTPANKIYGRARKGRTTCDERSLRLKHTATFMIDIVLDRQQMEVWGSATDAEVLERT
jgi:hypothetical protein